jgi:amino acid adenylation domain-containing protein
VAIDPAGVTGPTGGSAMADALVWLDQAEAALSQHADTNLPVIATSRDLAYVMYTSGSTGQPKGTCIEQRSIAHLVLGTDYVQLGNRDVVAHVSNTSFDAATFEIWGAVLTGATLHGISPDAVISPEVFARELADGGITAMFVTAALFHQVAAVSPRAFQPVEHLLVGGEAVDPAAVRRVQAAGPPRRLINAYGPTETTTFATWHLIGEIDDQTRSIPIGRPIAHTTVRILDRHRNLVPVGIRGELYIGGPGVARGYWNRPELTAERFVDDPFEPGGRLYRTGDLAAWRSDGAIEFHGRADGQVKLRGFRIELGEIETQLLAQAELAAATVVVRDDAGDPRLVAYVVPRAGAVLDLDAVRARLAQALPRYMLPSALVALDQLPMTPNGKVDRRALPAPSARRADLGGGYLAPEGDLERAIARIWAEVLGVDRVGASDNFFDLGGSSLLLVAARSRLSGVLGRTLPMVVLFQYPQVRTLAAHLAGLGANTAVAPSCLVQLQRGAGVTRPAPMFFVHGGGGHAVVYRDLARAIDPDRPAYGFAASGLERDQPLHTSVEDMASHYLELARAVHPDGPYLLVGASLGGMIAYEMARRLSAAGHAVPLCALLDAPAPGMVRDIHVHADAADLLAFFLDAGHWISPEQLRGLALDDQLERVLAAARRTGAVLPFGDLAEGRRLVAVWQNNTRAAATYTAPPWPGGEILYVAAGEPYPGVPAYPERGWIDRCAARVEVSSGDHLSMVTPPHAVGLGARIRSYLETRTRSTRL